MLLADVVDTSTAVAATASRLAKRAALVDLLLRVEADEIEIAVAYLSGELRQRRTGLGWAAVATLPPPADEPSLQLRDVDAAFDELATLTGAGSSRARSEQLRLLLVRATGTEQRFLRRLVLGDVRQGALDAAMIDAVAVAADVPIATVRRAVMLRGSTGPVAVAALVVGRDAVEAVRLTVGQPVRPMLASAAADVAAAFSRLGGATEAIVDTKLDGIRIQVHKAADRVWVFTRSLDDITSRLPEVAEHVRRLPVADIILDGEALALDDAGRPRPFQETAARTATSAAGTATDEVTPFFFDCLYVDGKALVDLPLTERLQRLDAIVPRELVASRVLRATCERGAEFFATVVAHGQEGVVVKAPQSPYDAGRRGSSWVKVKPRHTLDLVVLAVEEGSGRRSGFLSNIHLGARDPASDGFVMLGKTFKGMTDEMLRWQTSRFHDLQVSRTPHVVTLRPEQVVEVAFDGVQRSSRYPGGLALRFARVVRYRDDKSAAEADTIDTVRQLAESAAGR